MKISRSNLKANLKLLKIANIKQTDKILEIGSGYGVLLNILNHQGYDVVGIEKRKERVDNAKKLFSGDLPIKVGDGTKLMFDNVFFDCVVGFDVIEHIKDIDSHLAEVGRVLISGGKYLISTPNKYFNILFDIISGKNKTYRNNIHPSVMSGKELKNKLENFGFEVEFIKIDYLNEYYKNKLLKNMASIGKIIFYVMKKIRLHLYFPTSYYVIAVKK